MASADVFLLLDTVQFVKSEYDNRCKIKTADGEQWLTVPVSTPKINTLSRDVKISKNVDWKKLHKKTVTYNYSKTPHFEEFKSLLYDTYDENSESLIELNILLITKIKNMLGIEKNVYPYLRQLRRLNYAGIFGDCVSVLACRRLTRSLNRSFS